MRENLILIHLKYVRHIYLYIKYISNEAMASKHMVYWLGYSTINYNSFI